MTSLCPITKVPLAPGRFVSDQGISRFQESLTDLDSTMRALDAALAKELRFGDQNAGRSVSGGDRPLPISLAASDAKFVCRQVLLVWVDWLADARILEVPVTWADVGSCFTAQAGWLATSVRGAQCVDEVYSALHYALGQCDAPPPRIYLGQCRCGRRLHASRSAVNVECGCGQVVEVGVRQRELLNALAGRVFGAVDLARIFATVGVPISADSIRQWACRGRLHAVAGGYRVEDVLGVASLSLSR